MRCTDTLLRRVLSGGAGDLGAAYELRLGDDRFGLRVADGRLDATRGERPRADAVLESDPRTPMELVTGHRGLSEVREAGRLAVTGARGLVERPFDAILAREPAHVP